MKASYSWLRSLLPGLEANAADVAARLTCSGLEVEEILEYGAASPHVVLAEVRKIEPHPKRDKLKLVTVDRGGAEQVVVCGAPNVPLPGGKVVLAPLGTVLPAVGMTVGSRAIGGIVSEGMLCSEEELGLVGGGGKGDGILVLPAEIEHPLGTPLSQVVPATHDTVFEIGVTPNRPDAFGHIGLARDVAAMYELTFEPPTPDAPVNIDGSQRIEALASVVIDDTERCPHYGAALVLGVAVGPSPLWLRYRVESLGVRAISNVVDVTNLVLLEHGHPIHAFDLERLDHGKIVVRRATEGEKLTTLDGIERTLVEDDLVISDGARPLALAGVMGGLDSEIGDGSSGVLIECAYFAPRGIRRSSRRHSLHTEASHRFERGCDPRAIPDVLAQAASLITRLCGGKAVPGSIIAGVDPEPLRRIRLRHARMASLLGVAIDLDEASAILQRLGCEVERSEKTPDELQVAAPSHRPDLTLEEDLIEEVMRVYGIDRLPTTLRAVRPKTGRSTRTCADRVRHNAAALGLSEVLTYGFVAARQLSVLGADPACVRLQNPLTEERNVMRSSLLPGLLEAMQRARRHGVADVRLFALGRTFHASPDGEPLPQERVGFAAVLSGERGSGVDKRVPLDVYDAKGLACELVERVCRRDVRVRSGAEVTARHSKLHPRAAGELCIGEEVVGSFGPLHPDVMDAYELASSCLVIELDVDALRALATDAPQYRGIPTLPAVTRDLALVVSDDTDAGAVEACIAAAAGELCESVELFDLFRGKGVPDEHRSLAYRLVFRDPQASIDADKARTLTDKEVDVCAAQVMTAVREKLGATVRGA